jgi:hypothetical protein
MYVLSDSDYVTFLLIIPFPVTLEFLENLGRLTYVRFSDSLCVFGRIPWTGTSRRKVCAYTTQQRDEDKPMP